jgi:hypothetical protein
MPNRIGDFLLKIGAMTSAQVDEVLRLQQGGDSRIFGEIALELRYLNDDAIKRYVDHMEKWKTSPGDEPPTELESP